MSQMANMQTMVTRMTADFVYASSSHQARTDPKLMSHTFSLETLLNFECNCYTLLAIGSWMVIVILKQKTGGDVNDQAQIIIVPFFLLSAQRSNKVSHFLGRLLLRLSFALIKLDTISDRAILTS